MSRAILLATVSPLGLDRWREPFSRDAAEVEIPWSIAFERAVVHVMQRRLGIEVGIARLSDLDRAEIRTIADMDRAWRNMPALDHPSRRPRA